jgi:uncharacterized protein
MGEGRFAELVPIRSFSVAIFAFGAIWLLHAAPDGMAVMGTIFLASLLSSTAGFAFSALAGAALFHLVPLPSRAVEIMLVCSVANQAIMTWSMRALIVWKTVARYAVGGVIGVLAGVAAGRAMTSTTYVVLAGGFLTCYGIYTLFMRPPRLPELPPAIDTVVGLLSGFFGGTLAFPSVLVVIWSGCKGIDRHTQRAIYQPYILLMQCVAILAFLIFDWFRPGSPRFTVPDLLYMPVAALGTILGLRLFCRATERQFKAAVSAMLVASGMALIL